MAWYDYFRGMFSPNQTTPNVTPLDQYFMERAGAVDRSRLMPDTTGPRMPPNSVAQPGDRTVAGPDDSYRYVPGQSYAGQDVNPSNYPSPEGRKDMLPASPMDVEDATNPSARVHYTPAPDQAVPVKKTSRAGTTMEPLTVEGGGRSRTGQPISTLNLPAFTMPSRPVSPTPNTSPQDIEYKSPSEIENAPPYIDETQHPKVFPKTMEPPPPPPPEAPAAGNDVSEIQGQLADLAKLWPATPQVGGGQGDADKFAAGEMERAKMLANLAFFSGVTQGAGGGWEGVGKGLAAAGQGYSEGFDRYQKALQAKADRQLEQNKLDYQNKIGQLDLAYKMWNTKQSQKLGLSRLYGQQLRQQASTIVRKFNFDIGIASKRDPITGEYDKEKVADLTRQRDAALQKFYGMGIYGIEDPYTDPSVDPETLLPREEETQQ